MATTDVRLINQALSHLGHTRFIDARTEDTTEVSVSDVHYDDAVDYVLEDFAWGFAKRYVTLALVEEDPSSDWQFSYRYPVNAIKIRRIVTVLGLRDPNPPPFTIGSDDTARLIYTDEEDAVVEVTYRITDTALFSAQFAEAVSWWLGFLMVPGLAKDPGIAARCYQMYVAMIDRAAAHDGNEGQTHPPDESDAIRARA